MDGNHVTVRGRVKRDKTESRMADGTPVLNVTLIVGCRGGSDDMYVDCRLDGETVEMLDGHVSVGETIEVEGSLGYRMYTDRSGRVHRCQQVEVEYAQRITEDDWYVD